jgi:protein TonB
MHDFVALGACLVDADATAAARARRRCRWAVLCSIAGQVLLLSLILLAPLLATAELLAPAAPPDIIYFGRPAPLRAQQQKPAEQQGPKSSHRFKDKKGFFAPTKIPPKIMLTDEGAPDYIFSTSIPDATGIPGAIDGLGDPRGIPAGTRLPPAPVEKPQQPQKQIKVSEPVALARLIHRVEPRYPPLAKQMGLSGRVELRAVIARDGTIRDLQVLSGHLLLLRAATEAIEQWRFQPMLLNGEPVEVETRITVIFTLNR